MFGKKVLSYTLFTVFAIAAIASSIFAQELPPSPSPLTIDDAVKIALENNQSLLALREYASAARARLNSAESARLPQIQASATYNHTSNLPNIEIPTSNPQQPAGSFELGIHDTSTGRLSATQNIYSGGRISGQISRNEALYRAAKARIDSSEEQLAFQVRQAYFNVLLGMSLVTSAESTLKASQSQLKVANAQYEAGTSARFDVLRAQTQVSESEQALVEAKNQAATSRIILNRLLGVPLGNNYILSEPQTASFPDKSIQALIEDAMMKRGDIEAAQAQTKAAESGIKIARSEGLPNLGVTAAYLVTGKDNPGQATGLLFGAEASMSIFNGGKTRADISEAKSLRNEARDNLVETIRAADQDVRQAYLDLSTARQTIATARTRLTQAQDAYDISVVRYHAGVGTATEVADALATLASARTNLDRSNANYNITYARLQRALGVVEY